MNFKATNMSTVPLSPQISSSVDDRNALGAAIASALIALRAPADSPSSLQQRSPRAGVSCPPASDPPANPAAESATLAGMQIVLAVGEAACSSADLVGQF